VVCAAAGIAQASAHVAVAASTDFKRKRRDILL
jgi:hypothetical protein